MQNTPRPAGLAPIFALALALSSLSAGAGPLAGPDEASVKLDGIIQGLKNEAVEFNREAQNVEQDVLYPEHRRAVIYVSNKVSHLLIKEITITVNDGQPATHQYDDRSARALLVSEGFHRVATVNVAPGSHRIRAEFKAQFVDDEKDKGLVTGSLEEIFEKTQTAAAIELRISRLSRIASPKLSLVSWRPADSAEELAEFHSERKIRGRQGRRIK